MKVIVVGTRGIPDISGGVETHCQELYPRIASENTEITVITRSSYVKDKSLKTYKNINLKEIYAPKIKSFEAIIHTFLGVLYACVKRPDILHIHSIGPMLMTPLARLFGLKVVVTNHGPDYNRQKWGKIAKIILKTGEFLGTKFANRVIVISYVIKNNLVQKYKRNDCELIYNGVNIPQKSNAMDYLEYFGLKKHQYIIGVGRFVEEKGFHDLIKAYSGLLTDFKLVLVGDADHETEYSRKLKKGATESGVILTGFIKGEKLNQIFSHAALFVMPSYHEGLPIALLEAMSYNLNVLVSDIPANMEVNLTSSNYFEVGNISDLQQKMLDLLGENLPKNTFDKKLEDLYNWDKIAEKTLLVYKSII